jgi:hypothetical protein
MEILNKITKCAAIRIGLVRGSRNAYNEQAFYGNANPIPQQTGEPCPLIT